MRLAIKVTEETKAGQIGLVVDAINRGLAAGPVIVEFKRETRSLAQNRLLWPLLQDISQQLTIAGNRMGRDEWKDVLGSAFRQTVLMPGLNGSFVVRPLRTSRMGKKEFSDFIEFIYSVGSSPQDYMAGGDPVRWSDPALKAYEECMQ